MRPQATVLHLDLDAFFAAVEQRDKPSLRGKPVIVGGTGGRGVVATASYQARAYGVRSAMSTAQARALCPHGAYLAGRFAAYQQTSRAVMAVLRQHSDRVEPLSLDEAFVDLADLDARPKEGELLALGEQLKVQIAEATGGLTCSVGIGSSKLIAKIASELRKPDGLVLVPPGTEADLIAPMSIRALPGIGPATGQRLNKYGVQTVADVRHLSIEELISLLGTAQGTSLHALCRGIDNRHVSSERAAKSISAEDTFEHDLTDTRQLLDMIDRHARQVVRRLQKHRLAARTVTLKVRYADFTSHTRSTTLRSPTDELNPIVRAAHELLRHAEITQGVRLLGLGLSGFSDWVQDDLFDDPDAVVDDGSGVPAEDEPDLSRCFAPGLDVCHDEHGPGWVWGLGRDQLTVRFETATSGPGPVRTFALTDPALRRTTDLPPIPPSHLVGLAPSGHSPQGAPPR